MTSCKKVKLSKKGQFVLPKEARQALGVKEGDDLLVTVEENRVVLTRPQDWARRTRGLLKGLWGKDRAEVQSFLDGERDSWK